MLSRLIVLLCNAAHAVCLSWRRARFPGVSVRLCLFCGHCMTCSAQQWTTHSLVRGKLTRHQNIGLSDPKACVDKKAQTGGRSWEPWSAWAIKSLVFTDLPLMEHLRGMSAFSTKHWEVAFLCFTICIVQARIRRERGEGGGQKSRVLQSRRAKTLGPVALFAHLTTLPNVHAVDGQVLVRYARDDESRSPPDALVICPAR
jgi:hypothetical protein